MTDPELVTFLKWCLPKMELRWAGFRKIRRTVRKRLNRRIRELGLDDLAAYREKLQNDPAEWAVLDEICCIPISRFYRDKHVYNIMSKKILPDCAAEARKGAGLIRILSAGCASGEEPYSLSLIWHACVAENYPRCRLDILAVDIDDHMLNRALVGCYPPGAFKDLPDDLVSEGFCNADGHYCLRPRFRDSVRFERIDLRVSVPSGPFDMILCRNTAFTYFSLEKQKELIIGFDAVLRLGGYLILGSHETLPDAAGFHQLGPRLAIFQKELKRVNRAAAQERPAP